MKRTSTNRSRLAVAAATSIALVATMLGLAAPSAQAAPVVVAADMVNSASTNLISYSTDAPVFNDPADGYGKYQRGVSPSIPFALLDDSLVTFPADTFGIIDDDNVDEFFGAADTVNDDNSGPLTATWRFDIAGATDLSISIDMGAMGDFEASDVFEWSYSIDAGPSIPLFSLVADEAASRTYTLAGGATNTLNDPLDVGPIELSNVLQPVGSSLSGTGTTLTLTLLIETNGAGEAVAFQNIVITGDDSSEPGGPAPGDLIITEVMQNPSAVFDSAGEWFEIRNVSGQTVSLNGWIISDDDFDSHTIAGPVVVPAGGTAVLGNNADLGTNGGVGVDYQYSGFFLSNGADEIVLIDPTGLEFDRIEYDGGPVWPDPNGASMNLDPASTDTSANDDGANWCAATSTFGAGDRGTPGASNDTCEPPITVAFVHEVQGTGPSVAITTPVQVQAIVTSLFTRDDVLDGFFIQEEDADADADAGTSEGIFVYCRNNCPAPGNIAVGDLVTVVGTPTDFFGMSQIDIAFGNGTVDVDGSGNALPTPIPVVLGPSTGSTLAEATFENVEGMIVTFPNTLAVSEYFQLARYGQVVLTDTTRPYQYTHTNLPSAGGYATFLADLETRRVILDDDNNDQNDPISDGPDEAYPQPEGGLSLTNRFRGGDTIDGLTGVLHWSFAGQPGTDAWRVRPIPDAFDYTFMPRNPAPTTPADSGGSLSIGSFNVLNYFTTLDEPGATCGPNADDCRGAHSAAELARQREKIVAAIAGLNADVLGLVELENDGDDSSIADLVAGLNAVVGPGTYDYVATGFIGSDAIKVGLIYQPATVTPVGPFAILDDSVDPTFTEAKNRPVLIQTFREVATGEKVTVAVNHLKSKGSACDDLGDSDRGDGQANCPGTRTAGAIALANYLATDPTGSGDPDFLVVGDLNAYAMEDPIMALVDAGYTDLVARFLGSAAYSYVFDGQLGYLDHALANASLLDQVTGVSTWHINADEVPLFDYNDDVQDAGEASFERESTVGPLYAPDPFRSSDHDPVVVGLLLDSIPDDPECNGLPATIIGTQLDDVIVGTNGDDVIVTFGGNDVVDGGNGNDTICTGPDDDVVTGGNGADYVDAGSGNDTIDTGNGDDTVVGGSGDDNVDTGKGDDTIDGGDGLGDVADAGLGVDTCAGIELATGCELTGLPPS